MESVVAGDHVREASARITWTPSPQKGKDMILNKKKLFWYLIIAAALAVIVRLGIRSYESAKYPVCCGAVPQ